MRVIAGEARGFPLKAPRDAATRPTSDKVRGAIFSMLASLGLDAPERVLDLYAGSGALAIEALSRGAEHADLVERASSVCAVARENLAKTRFTERARVLQGDVERLLPDLKGPYDLVFLDPPYADARAPEVVQAVGSSGLVRQGGAIVYEHGKRTVPPAASGAFAARPSRCHGDTCITIYV